MTQNGHRTIAIRPFGSVDVDLWGHPFETVPATRTVHRRQREISAQIDEAGDDDASVKLLAELIDLRLKPAGNARKKASAFILEKWEADQLSVPQLEQLLDDLLETDRPT